MSLAPGTRIGSYEVLSLVGAGAMGEVYRARDTRLQRDVAVKVLPEPFTADPDRLVRFEREAKSLASLNHPNIAQIYGLEGRAIVMELVEGRTLGELIGIDGLPIGEVLAIARQIADALEAAHDRGIVHRDLKPDNIKLDEEGTVKVLDFGLAKAVGAAEQSDPNSSPTVTSAPTAIGVILGTAAYMSPEQARGRGVDRRADVWAFGVILVEMLSGRHPFRSDDVSQTLASVLAREPDLAALPVDTPGPVRRLIARCLEKDPKRRLRHIGDAMRQLDEELSAPAAAPTAAAERPRVWIPWTVAAAAILLTGSVAGWVLTRPAPRLLTTALSLALPDGTYLSMQPPVVSPDGERVAFVAATPSGTNRLWVRQLGSPDVTALAGTDGAAFPFWSPDGSRVAFLGEGRNLKTIRPDGSDVVVVASALSGSPRGGTWGEGGDILVGALQGGLLHVRVNDGTISRLTETSPGQTGHLFPQFLPGGQDFLLHAREEGRSSVYRASLKDPTLKLVVAGEFAVRFVPPGYLVSYQADTLSARRYVPETAELDGERTVLAAEVSRPANGFPTVDGTNDVLIWLEDRSGGTTPVWFDGAVSAPIGTLPTDLSAPALSRDGQWLAAHRTDPASQASDIWVFDLTRGTQRRITSTPVAEAAAVWSPDGRHLAFTTVAGAVQRDIDVVPVSAPGEQQRLVKDNAYKTPTDWSADGQWLLYQVRSTANADLNNDVRALRLSGDRTSVVVANGPSNQTDAHFSPDGHWVAFSSEETGRPEIQVQAFPSRANRIVVSVDGGRWPTWSRDGRELAYLAPDDRLMVVPITVRGEQIEAGRPTKLFQTATARIAGRNYYDRGPDGRFIVFTQAAASSRPPLSVLTNWRERLPRP